MAKKVEICKKKFTYFLDNLKKKNFLDDLKKNCLDDLKKKNCLDNLKKYMRICPLEEARLLVCMCVSELKSNIR